MIFSDSLIGTKHRNHCPYCLWSLHVDNRPGDRMCDCRSRMKPIGLTFGQLQINRYTGRTTGEIKLVHLCLGCSAIKVNRIAGDDNCHTILEVFNSSLEISTELKNRLERQDIFLLTKEDKDELLIALFGYNYRSKVETNS
ncbi:RNHCP domain-containing protein [Candidatus Woesebacteria bacterium]|nr:RNHCP domain-containing protein [Candidatus Woesebacteria bacterium]